MMINGDASCTFHAIQQIYRGSFGHFYHITFSAGTLLWTPHPRLCQRMLMGNDRVGAGSPLPLSVLNWYFLLVAFFARCLANAATGKMMPGLVTTFPVSVWIKASYSDQSLKFWLDVSSHILQWLTTVITASTIQKDEFLMTSVVMQYPVVKTSQMLPPTVPLISSRLVAIAANSISSWKSDCNSSFLSWW